MKLQDMLVAATLAVSGGLSHAAQPDPIALRPSGPGVLSGTFTRTADGLFVDSFSFLPESFSGRVSVSLSSLGGSLSFFTASLNGHDFSYFPESGNPVFAFQARVSADRPLGLTVFGAVLDATGKPRGAGSYTGTVTAAVPEPAAWALMLAGLAGVGWLARRRADAG